MFDTNYTVETPEGIELTLRVAGPVVRAFAWGIDFVIRSIIYIALAILFSQLGDFGTGLLLMSIFILEWFYPVLFEVYRQGATPGKHAMKIKVLHELGTPIDWSASMIRNLLRVVDFLPFLYGFGLITTLLNKNFKRLGDLVAGTIVVYADEISNSTVTTLSKELPKPMPIILTLNQQQAIIEFAERSQYLPYERNEELANIVTSITGENGYSGIKTLYQFANGLIGERYLETYSEKR